MSILLKKSVVFFELDGVIRRIRPDRAKAYIDQYQELPPAPLQVGDQELIERVARWIADYCEQHNCIAIGLDQAPYLAHGFSEETYGEIIRELMRMLLEFGVPVKDILWCEHPLLEETVYDEHGNSAVSKTAQCQCRFPNEGLIKAAVQKHDVTVFNDRGEYRLFHPSIFVLNSNEARTAAIEKCGLNVQWVEAILTGRAGLLNKAEHAHLKAAALIKQHQKQGGLKQIGNDTFTVDTDKPLDLPALPQHLDKPIGS